MTVYKKPVGQYADGYNTNQFYILKTLCKILSETPGDCGGELLFKEELISKKIRSVLNML